MAYIQFNHLPASLPPFVLPRKKTYPSRSSGSLGGSIFGPVGFGLPGRSSGWRFVWIFFLIFCLSQKSTLQGTNISHLGRRKIIFKSALKGDMLVPWRVFKKNNNMGLLHYCNNSRDNVFLQWSGLIGKSIVLHVSPCSATRCHRHPYIDLMNLLQIGESLYFTQVMWDVDVDVVKCWRSIDTGKYS